MRVTPFNVLNIASTFQLLYTKYINFFLCDKNLYEFYDF